MIGNDIVDLKQAAKESNWQRPRFLEKVFTQSEQEYIASSKDQHQMVWLLWSMKEAAYKVNVQQFGKRFFNPKKLECELVSLEKGMVFIGGERYFTVSEITEDFVYTVATLSKSKKGIRTSIFKDEKLAYKIQSEVLKRSFMKSFSQTEKIILETLEIKKTASGVPQLFHNSKKLRTSFSLTHCGRFSGFVYC